MSLDKLEDKARLDHICRGCGKEKTSGVGACIVCWDCWKHPHFPYKYWDGTFKQWLEAMHGTLLEDIPF